MGLRERRWGDGKWQTGDVYAGLTGVGKEESGIPGELQKFRETASGSARGTGKTLFGWGDLHANCGDFCVFLIHESLRFIGDACGGSAISWSGWAAAAFPVCSDSLPNLDLATGKRCGAGCLATTAFQSTCIIECQV